jgi:hypothetical protein
VRVLAVLFLLAGFFCLAIGIFPPPWWPPPSGFQRVLAVIVGLTALANGRHAWIAGGE